MTKNIWEEFDTNTDLDGFKTEVQEADNNSGDFEPLPHGKYEVALEDLELKPTKKGNKPMIVSTFKVLEGQHKGRLIWVNQVVDLPMKMSIGLKFINKMAIEKIEFRSMADLADDLEKAVGPIQEKHEFVLNFFENKKGYDQYEIDDVFDLE